MPLHITGMHRSGTSMVTRLLHDCGLYLGPESDLLPPAADNPQGFWENTRFLRLNDSLLKAVGAAWDRPPQESRCRPDQPAWKSHRGKALHLLHGFRKREPWGWKDPRGCLTLPFWRELIPDLRILICVRNPLAVARSLTARGNVWHTQALTMWLNYYEQLLQTAPRETRLVTHYERYFVDPHAELDRVLRGLSIAAHPDVQEQACANVMPELAHHRAEIAELCWEKVPDGVVECYRALCVEGGMDAFPVEKQTAMLAG